MKQIIVFNRTLHRKMWIWLSDHPDYGKSEWPGIKHLSERDRNMLSNHFNCFACAATGNIVNINEDIYNEKCNKCPLKWSAKVCWEFGAEYEEYSHLISLGTADADVMAMKVAKKIANLPVVEHPDVALVVI